METILLTGANGLLGQKIASQLNIKDVQLVATSRSSNKSTIIGKNSIFEMLDITNKEALNHVCSIYKPSIIINAAALTNVNGCEVDREKCMEINSTGVQNIAEAANNINAHLVHLSTDFVFDGLSGPYSENDTPNPVNFYGKSKLEGERRIMEICKRYSIVRTILVYGMVEYMPRSNFILWIKNSLEKKTPVNVISDQFRMPTLAEDMAGACINIALNKKEGIFHISGNEMMSILEIACQVADFFNLDKGLITPITSYDLREVAKRPPKTGFILEKAKRELNYSPHSFAKGLEIIKSQIGLLEK